MRGFAIIYTWTEIKCIWAKKWWGYSPHSPHGCAVYESTTAWRYGSNLLVLKTSLTRKRYYQHSKIKSVSPHSRVISSMYCITSPSTYHLSELTLQLTVSIEHLYFLIIGNFGFKYQKNRILTEGG